MSLSAVVVDAAVGGRCSVQPSRLVNSFWLQCESSEKINLDLKNKRVAFSQRDICILCENSPAPSAVPMFYHVNYLDKKKKKHFKMHKAS